LIHVDVQIPCLLQSSAVNFMQRTLTSATTDVLFG